MDSAKTSPKQTTNPSPKRTQENAQKSNPSSNAKPKGYVQGVVSSLQERLLKLGIGRGDRISKITFPPKSR